MNDVCECIDWLPSNWRIWTGKTKSDCGDSWIISVRVDSHGGVSEWKQWDLVKFLSNFYLVKI